MATKISSSLTNSAAAIAAPDDHGNQAADASLLTTAAIQRGILNGAQDNDYFKFTVQAGHTYTFTLNNDPAGSHISNGILSLQGSSSATGSEAPLRFHAENYGASYGVLTAAYSGDYYLAVKTPGLAPGKEPHYTLAVQERAPDDIGNDRGSAAALATDGKVSGKLDYTGDADWFKIQLQPNASYALLLRGQGSGEGTLPVTGTSEGLRLFTATGSELPFQHSTFDGTRSITAATGGDYYVAVESTDRVYGVSAGSSYTLHLQTISGDTAAPVLTSPAPAASPVGLFDNIVVAFNEAVGRTINGSIFLLDASGSQVNSTVVSTGAGYVIDPIGHLRPGATYTVSLAPIADAAGNPHQGSLNLTYQARSADTRASAGNDLLVARGEGMRIDGGSGCDMVVYDAYRGNADITLGGSEIRVKPNSWSTADVLTGVERLLFTNTAVAYDTAGAGGQAYRLYQAAFDRAPDARGIGYWIAQMDKGASLREVAQSFIDSTEFSTLYGGTATDADFVGKLYQNVLHRAGDQAGVDYWNGILAKGATRAEVLTWFSEGTENQAAVAKIIGNGFEYTPYG
jgi:hypothetical protein